jgi:hypothetical protein
MSENKLVYVCECACMHICVHGGVNSKVSWFICVLKHSHTTLPNKAIS